MGMLTAAAFGLAIFGPNVIHQFVEKIDDLSSNFVFAAQLAMGMLLGFPLKTTTRAQPRWPWVEGWVRPPALAQTLVRAKRRLRAAPLPLAAPRARKRAKAASCSAITDRAAEHAACGRPVAPLSFGSSSSASGCSAHRPKPMKSRITSSLMNTMTLSPVPQSWT